MSDTRDWAEAGFVRIYQTVRDDPKFASVYKDDRAFAAYVRLLLDVEPVYPNRASLPAHLKSYARTVLEDAGILIVKDGRFTLSGLVKEREGRKARYGKDGTGRPRFHSDTSLRHSSESVEESTPTSEATRAGASVSDMGGSSSSSSEGGPGETDPLDEVKQWLASHKAWVDSPKVETVLARMVDRKGGPAVIAAMAALTDAEEAAQFVYGARNALFPLSGSQTVSKDVTEAQTRARRRAELGLEALK